MRSGLRPCRREQHQNRDFPADKVLLIPEILVSGNQELIALCFCSLKKNPISQFVPSPLGRGIDKVSG